LLGNLLFRPGKTFNLKRLKMETKEPFFTGDSTYTIFALNSDKSFLPFPINQNLFVRVMICSVLASILVIGFRKRFLILAYMTSPEVKMNPPNVLFGLDQVNGIFLAMIIIYRITFNLLPEPLSDLVDPRICYFAELMSGSYVSGTIVWRCYIAILKLLYVKAQNWMQNTLEITKLLTVLVILGLAKMALFSSVMVSSENDSYVKRSCYHRNSTDLEILYGFEVGIKAFVALNTNTDSECFVGPDKS